MKHLKPAPRRRDNLRACKSQEEAQLFINRWCQLMGVRQLHANSEIDQTVVIDLTLRGEIVIALPKLENVEGLEIVLRRKEVKQAVDVTPPSEPPVSEEQEPPVRLDGGGRTA